jgi:hypothetical protein
VKGQFDALIVFMTPWRVHPLRDDLTKVEGKNVLFFNRRYGIGM